MDLSNAPTALKAWAQSKTPEFTTLPAKLTPAHVEETLTWYRSLLPSSRQRRWPASQKSFSLSDYDHLKKPGAKGFFLVLMAVSWIPTSGYASNVAVRTTSELVSDIMWIMTEMLDAIGGLEDVVVNLKDSTSALKRTAASNGRSSKRRRVTK